MRLTPGKAELKRAGFSRPPLPASQGPQGPHQGPQKANSPEQEPPVRQPHPAAVTRSGDMQD